ncbi:hypothetical protein Asulf_00095 [Archaeoglobus sulfaticallidus PM70-1]|uniref:CARDB domain-containing protein n=1 Tax=Archaeoglobus sulfaticallidus PM70-1 TaxID=387631 RepID=N0BI58_9EURY|nr:COG1361 S-layer family protein [Archaeoglobus sulfaticallidus]AGK60131.1 hypothetical protein Asulf_00095 [Archaeoglobus sulfaticallidus PM70-1]
MKIKFLIPLLCSLLLVNPAIAQSLISLSYHTIPQNPTTGYFVISIDISNAGGEVKGLELFLSESEKDFSFYDEKSSLDLRLGDLASGSTSAQVKAYAKKPGIYQIDVDLKYYDVNLSAWKSINSVFALMVSEKSIFSIEKDYFEISANEDKEYRVRIKNLGGDLGNIRIGFKTPEGIVADSSVFDSWKAGEEKEISFRLSANDVRAGNYGLYLVIDYVDTLNNEGTDKLPLTLKVLKKPMISLTSDIPDKIYPDSDFVISIQIRNSGNCDLKNLRARLDFPDEFVGEKEKFLGYFEVGETKIINYSITAKDYAKPGSYRFSLRLEADDFAQTSDIEVFVKDPGRISIDIAGVYTSPQRILGGDNFKLSLQLENSGKRSAKAVYVKLTLPEGFEGKNSYFIGTLESGDSATANLDLKAGKPGLHEVKAEISYMDMAYKKHSVTKTFTLYVFPKDSSYIFGFAGLIALLIVAYLLKKKRRKK